jgi:large subunit ribosomal protein L13
MTKSTMAATLRSTSSWFIVDASQEVLGRMAAKIATLLQGKHKPTWTPHADVGDFVVVINAADVKLTGRKAADKVYRSHTGWPGGLREISYPAMKAAHPTTMVREAVRRMLPKTTLGRHMLTKLKVFPGKEHTHHAQKPEKLAFATSK